MRTMTNNDNFLGRKIFFLYPSAVVLNRITEELIQQEFEVYVIKDHIKIRGILKKHPNSIVFVNIYDGMSEAEWEIWIKGVMAETAGVGIGIISPGEDEAVREKYLNQIKIPCGYTVLKSDLNLVLTQLFEILKIADAKGRRKYIRAVVDNEANTTVNLPINGTFINGTIKYISVVGFSCFFADDTELTKNSLFQDIQIRLQSSIIKAEGIVFGSRMDGNTKIYVVLFTQRMDSEVRAKIRRFIQSNLQAKMDA